MADSFATLTDNAPNGLNTRSNAFAQARRHSRLVKILKFVLPVTALAILAGFGLVALQARNLPDVAVADIVLEGGRIVMDSPKLNGVTADNLPYSVHAQRALQSVTDINDIELEGIVARIPFGSDATADVQAPVGHLNNERKLLLLKGGFDLTTSDGLVAKLQEAEFDFENRTLKTTMPVDIKRAGTHIQADSMTVSEGGATLVFEKRVRMTLQPDAMEKAKEPANGG